MWNYRPRPIPSNYPIDTMMYQCRGRTKKEVVRDLVQARMNSDWVYSRDSASRIAETGDVDTIRVVCRHRPFAIMMQRCIVFAKEMEIIVRDGIKLGVIKGISLVQVDFESSSFHTFTTGIPFLVSLVIDGVFLSLGDLKTVAENITSLMQMLKISRVSMMDHVGFGLFVDGLTNGKSELGLRSLDISNNKISALDRLGEILVCCPQIEMVDLSGNFMLDDDQIGLHVLTSLSVCSRRLNTVCVDNTRVSFSMRARVAAWFQMRYRSDVGCVLAFASRRIVRSRCSVSRLFSDADRILGEFLVGSNWL